MNLHLAQECVQAFLVLDQVLRAETNGEVTALHDEAPP